MTVLIILCAAAAGGLLFHVCGIPGGMIVGAIAGVVVVKCLGELPPVAFPRPLQGLVYILLGAIVGNMFDPAMFAAVRETWPRSWPARRWCWSAAWGRRSLPLCGASWTPPAPTWPPAPAG